MLTISDDIVKGLVVGDTFTFDGKTYQIIKKTLTAIAVRRYYWFDRVYNKLFGITGLEDNGDHPKFVG